MSAPGPDPWWLAGRRRWVSLGFYAALLMAGCLARGWVQAVLLLSWAALGCAVKVARGWQRGIPWWKL